jgi:2'-5' RNA ligase
MRSIVSLLGGRQRAAVENLRIELEGGFTREGFCPTPYPHVSFHVAESYDAAALKPALERVASTSPPLRVLTAGLGIFTGATHPVIYLPVVRTAALSEFHRKVWEAANEACDECMAHYEPARWVPHITLAQGEFLTEHLPEIVELLWRRDFSWEIELGSLSLIYDDGARQGVEVSVELAKPPSAEPPRDGR